MNIDKPITRRHSLKIIGAGAGVLFAGLLSRDYITNALKILFDPQSIKQKIAEGYEKIETEDHEYMYVPSQNISYLMEGVIANHNQGYRELILNSLGSIKEYEGEGFLVQRVEAYNRREYGLEEISPNAKVRVPVERIKSSKLENLLENYQKK